MYLALPCVRSIQGDGDMVPKTEEIPDLSECTFWHETVQIKNDK